MWGMLKNWVLEQVLWAEQHLKGKSGAEKRKAVVDKLDELIKLPWYLECVDGPIIGWLVDVTCDRLNWLTDFDFSGCNLTQEEKVAITSSLEAPLTDVETAIMSNVDLDAKLKSLCDEYGITQKLEEKPAAPGQAQAVPDDFNRCITFCLKWEGGRNFDVVNGKPVIKGNATADLGGATAYGITWRTLKAAHAAGIVAHDDICKLTEGEARLIYKANYWTRYGWNELEWPVNLCCLDCSINHGKFALILQRAINDVASASMRVEVDGKFGPETYNALLAASVTNASASALASAIIERRREYFRNIVAKNPTQKGFLKGWLNRCDALAVACKEV